MDTEGRDYIAIDKEGSQYVGTISEAQFKTREMEIVFEEVEGIFLAPEQKLELRLRTGTRLVYRPEESTGFFEMIVQGIRDPVRLVASDVLMLEPKPQEP